MRKTFLFATVAGSLLSVPAMAAGYVGAAYDRTSAHSVTTTEADTWQGEGAFGFAGGHWGAQVDAAAGSSSDFDFWTLSGHAFWVGTGWRLGGVVATSQLDVGAGVNIDETTYGVEGSYDFGPNTVGLASATFGSDDIPPIGGFDTWNADVGLNHYIGTNARIGGSIGIGNLDGPTITGDTFSIGVKGEWQPWAAPVSITAGYSHFNADLTPSLDSDSFSIGLRWSFGGGTLRDRDNATPFDAQTGLYQRIFDLR